MPMFVRLGFGVILSYLIGSIPTAYIAGRFFKNIDIREHGSGNVGATNAFRVLGKTLGILVLVIDAIKGAIPIVFISRIVNLDVSFGYILLGLASVCGHNWTVFLRFKGGKGVATSLGVLAGLAVQIDSFRIVLALVVLSWAATFLALGYVSLASIVAGVLFPVFTLLFTYSSDLIILSAFLCLFVILRHRPNINRLLHGKERRVSTIFRKNLH